jgi:hypothetical protein
MNTQLVAELFLKEQNIMPSTDETKLAALYAEFADEDRKLAEEGMDEYTAGLLKEDTK